MIDREGLKEEDAVKIFDLVVKEHMLPATLDKLVPLSFIGSAAVKFYQAKVKLMDQLGMSEAQRKATLSDGQDAGEMLLDIEARIGELLVQVPREQEGKRAGKAQRGEMAKAGFGGESHKEVVRANLKANQAQAIHRNPAAVRAIIKEARENEDIPTKTAVLNKIRYDAEKARPKAEKSNFVATVEQKKYLDILDGIILMLPSNPPRDWREEALEQARKRANIIIKRLEVFNGKGTKVLPG